MCNWLFALATEPVRCVINGIRQQLADFADASPRMRGASTVLTLGLAMVFPVATAVSAAVSLSYTCSPNPLLRILWDVSAIILLAEIVQVVPLIVLPLSLLSIHSLIKDTAARAAYYAEEDRQ